MRKELILMVEIMFLVAFVLMLLIVIMMLKIAVMKIVVNSVMWEVSKLSMLMRLLEKHGYHYCYC